MSYNVEKSPYNIHTERFADLIAVKINDDYYIKKSKWDNSDRLVDFNEFVRLMQSAKRPLVYWQDSEPRKDG